jgi:hypothetical protein
MNALIKIVLVAATLAPALASAQSIEPLTRDQVRAELVQLENAGFDPFNDCTGDCHGSLRRAEASLAHRRSDASNAYGPGFDGTAQSGR